MKGFFQHTWGKLIAVALSLSLVAAAAALVLAGTWAPLRNVGETVSRPFLRLFSTVTETVRQGADNFQRVQRLQEEKAALEQQVAQLQDQARAGELAQAENARQMLP